MLGEKKRKSQNRFDKQPLIMFSHLADPHELLSNADMTTLPLYNRKYDESSQSRISIVLLHGFLGSATNWHSVARRLSKSHPVIVPDLRNHGQSPHAEEMTYAAMAADLEALLKEEDLREVILVGHSMGGKLAMEYALRHPNQVKKLVVVDIAPVRYRHGFDEVFKALRAVDLERVENRRDADAMMQAHLETEGLRQFLLQNLVKQETGWSWRIDPEILAAAVPQVQATPPSLEGGRYEGPTLFVHGADSDYVSEGFKPVIRRHFPQATFDAIANAGHWVYAEQPADFMHSLETFLEK